MIRSFLLVAMIVWPQMSWAQVGIDVDTARVVKPQHAEVIGGMTAASGQWALSAKGRLGIADGLDTHMSLSGIYLEDNMGFEYAMGARYGIFGNRKNSAVDISVAGDLAITHTGPLMAITLDPKILMSTHFAYAGKREIALGLVAGAASGFESRSEEDDDAYLGMIGGAVLGLDITDALHCIVDVTWRHDALHIGAGAMVRF